MTLCSECLGQKGFGDIVSGWTPCGACDGTGQADEEFVIGASRPIQKFQPYHVLVRIQRVRVSRSEDIGPVAYVPLWWKIDNHDGCNDAVADGAYTISIATLTSTTKADAHKEFAATYGFYAPLLDGVTSLSHDDFAGQLDSFMHATAMAEWWMDRAKAIQDRKPPPGTKHPMHDYKPVIGDRVRVALLVDAVVRDKSDGHGLCYELHLDRRDYAMEMHRFVWVDADEILGIIDAGEPDE